MVIGLIIGLRITAAQQRPEGTGGRRCETIRTGEDDNSLERMQNVRGDSSVVFLDELTAGLDPQARRAIWALVRGIRKRGKTVFLTTHLMEEAQRLCDRVAIIEHGRIIDIGAPETLVQRHCPERTVVLSTDDPAAEERLRAIPRSEAITSTDSRLTIRGSGDDFVTDVIHCLSEYRIKVTDFRTVLPNLEDVFLKLTGRSIRD